MLNNEQIDQILKKLNINSETSIDDDRYKKLENVYKYAIDMTTKEAKQGAEGLIHNLNSLQSRSGQQLPFSSINFGTCSLSEGRLISFAILDAELDGTGPLHKTPIFPCSIFQYNKEINGNPDSPNYDIYRKALLCTSKRLYPNYCNTGWSTDVNNTKTDIENKQKVLDKLSNDNMQKLVKWCENNKLKAINYRMEVRNNKVVLNSKVLIPVEISSTMGCIDAKETITIRQNGVIETLTIGEFYERLVKENNADSCIS